jgi:Mg-chelatase subunit ChlD
MSRTNSHDDEDSLLRTYEEESQPRQRGRMSDSGSNSSAERLSSFANSNLNTTSTGQTSDFVPVSPRDANGKPITQRAAVDAVLVVSCAASMHGLKLQIMKDALKFVAKNLGDYDRMALVVFGGSSGPEVIAGMTRKNTTVWEKAIDALENGPRGVKTEVTEGVTLGISSHGPSNVALDILSKRRALNPVTSVLVVSDSPSGQTEGVEHIVARANDMEYIFKSPN